MRMFGYTTAGLIVEDIQREMRENFLRKHPEVTPEEYDRQARLTGPEKQVPVFTRTQFYRLKYKLNFPEGEKTPKGWEKYKDEEADEIKSKLRNYFLLPN